MRRSRRRLTRRKTKSNRRNPGRLFRSVVHCTPSFPPPVKGRGSVRSTNQRSCRRNKRSTRKRTRVAFLTKPTPKAKKITKLKQITFSGPLDGNKAYCGQLDYLPSNEYSRFGSRHECLVKGLRAGYGSGRNAEYSYLRKLLLREGYEIPKKEVGRTEEYD